MNGKVKFFNDEKHFGFISGDDGKEYFVHISGLAEGTQITENDEVSFEVEEGDRGLKAVNVKKGASSDESEDSEDEELQEAA